MVETGYIRALPPTVKDTAAYLTLHNHADREMTLVAAHTEIADKVEMHETMYHNGQLHMTQHKEVDIPAQGSLVFADGGLHFMIVGLKKLLVPGDEVSLVLEFADGSKLPVTLPVKSPMAGGNMEHNH
jgi:copper(I)-binding protein